MSDGLREAGEQRTGNTEVVRVTVGEERDGERRVQVYDQVMGAAHELFFRGAGPVRRVSTDTLQVPVDAAVETRVAGVRLPDLQRVSIRDGSSGATATIGDGDSREFDYEESIVDYSTEIKQYLLFEGPVQVEQTGTQTVVRCDGQTRVRVGARSLHRSPAGTITVPRGDWEAACTAVSAFSSALKAPASPERAWPTLRGHPPLVEFGDELRIPAHLSPPETGVELHVPPEPGYVLPAAPLSFYLGADVVPTPGERPLLSVGDFEHELPSGEQFSAAVAQTLRHVLTCDCVVRSEGLMNYELTTDGSARDLLGATRRRLYEASEPERLETYLSVPFEEIESYAPSFRTTAHVEPTPETLCSLPFLANDLAAVRPRTGAGQTAGGGATDDGRVTLPETDIESMSEVWLGDGVPETGEKAVRAAYRARSLQSPSDEPFTVTVVCLDDRMADEFLSAARNYGQGDALSQEVSVEVHADPTVADLRALLQSETRFVHFVGHAESCGLRCADGYLDVRSMDSVGVESFFLNACDAVTHGVALCERGAVGGVVATGAVDNAVAETVGQTVAKLLNTGYTIRAAVDVVGRLRAGDDYAAVGYGGHTVTVNNVGDFALVCLVDERPTAPDGEVAVEIGLYNRSGQQLGTMGTTYLEEVDGFRASPTTLGPVTVDVQQLFDTDVVGRAAVVVPEDRCLYWSDVNDPADLVEG